MSLCMDEKTDSRSSPLALTMWQKEGVKNSEK